MTKFIDGDFVRYMMVFLRQLIHVYHDVAVLCVTQKLLKIYACVCIKAWQRISGRSTQRTQDIVDPSARD